jgi:hypothetical protein
MNRRSLIRRLALPLLAAALLASCAAKPVLEDIPEPLGDFSLGYNIVVVDHPAQGPFSRDATDAELKAAMEKAIQDRFGRFHGENTYHIAVKIEAYALARAGIPVVFKPVSVLAITANVWTTEAKLNEKPESITAFEAFDGNSLIGSGLTRTKEQQLAGLAEVAADKIETWLRTHPEWFGITGDEAARIAAEALAKQAADAAALKAATEKAAAGGGAGGN